ncbi:MAG: SH3 domain-containing protein [Planctomycetes bacterium]|nr:SH3 domain-containing protein [Planctomycetota bacterium]
MKRIILIAVMLSCGAFLWAPIYAQDVVKVKEVREVTAKSLNMRNGPGTNFASLHVVKMGDKLQVVGEKLGWVEVIIPPGVSCWISAKFIERKEGGKGTVKGNKVNVRSSTSNTANNIIGQVSADAEVTIIGEEEGWLKIIPPANLTAWVSQKYTKYWGKQEDYEKLKDKAEEMIKERDRLEKLLKEADTIFAKESVKHPLDQNLEEALSMYQEVADKSTDEKLTAKAIEQINIIKPSIAVVRQVKETLVKLEEEYDKAEDERRKIIKEVMEKLVKEMKPPLGFVATGTVDYVGKIMNRPGTHRLVKGDETIYFLVSPDKKVDLNKYYGKQVGVNGEVKENKNYPQRTIVIKSEEDIKILGEEEQPKE